MKIKFNNELDVAIQPTPTQIAGANTQIGIGAGQDYKAPVTGAAGDIGIWLAALTTSGICRGKKIPFDQVQIKLRSAGDNLESRFDLYK